MQTEKRYGYTGRGLRVNLTTGKITPEPTFPRFADFIGGTGLGYKVFWDEVPPDTKPFDEANKIVIAPGPLSGTAAVCSGRTAVTTIFPTTWPVPMICSAHMGGDFAHKLKYAGWDFIIIEGASKTPVYLYIHNDKVELRDASFIWGQGTRRSTEQLLADTTPEASVAVIGQAGENKVPMSILLCMKSHSAGGVGGVFGSKNLKALVAFGDETIHIHANPKDWEALCDRNRALLGAVTQTVVPKFPNPLFEYSSTGSRWSGMPGRVWGAANPPVTLTSDMRSLNRIAYRTCAADHYLGPQTWKYVVRNNGCYGCPIRCYSVMRDDETAAKYKVDPITEQTCMSLYFGRRFFPKIAGSKTDPRSRPASLVGIQILDDLGIWCNYGQLHRDWCSFYTKGIWKKVLPEKEYASFDWQKIEDCDPIILHDLLPRIAYRKGELGYWLGEGCVAMLNHFGLSEDDWRNDHGTAYWNLSHPKHHANEDDGQAGCVLNCMYNRDPMCHGGVNFTRSGLPLALQKQIAKKFWGSEDAVDAIGDYKPTNRYKMIRLRWIIARKELHDMLGLCSWSAPWYTSPNKEDGYVGDVEMESKLYQAVTGKATTQDELDKAGLRAFLLERAYTQRQMKVKDMRHEHDRCPEWIYHDAKGRKPFTKGTIVMDRADMEKSFDLFYDVMKFDVKTGAATRAAYDEFGLGYVADTMKKEGLLP